jgi:hypothetical protein
MTSADALLLLIADLRTQIEMQGREIQRLRDELAERNGLTPTDT